MATYGFTVYEVDDAYFSGEDGSIIGTDTLTITDGDGLLHAAQSVDPGGDQSFSLAGEPTVTDYSVDYLDFAQLNGGGPNYELFAMQIDFAGGGSKYYVMSKDPGFAPSIGNDLTVTSYSNFTNTSYGDIESSVCFAGGTWIATPSGLRAIESLRRGDVVLTVDNGPKEILWVGSRHLDGGTLNAHPHLRPVLIKPCPEGPDEAILVSPQHRMHLVLNSKGGEERLIRAKHLAQYASSQARTAWGKSSVQYFHILLDQHELLFANGWKSESLMPGKMALRGLSRADRREIAMLFPELDVRGATLPEQFRSLVRPLLPRHQVSKRAFQTGFRFSA